MTAPAAQFEGVSKSFRLGERHDSALCTVANLLKRCFGKKLAPRVEEFWALRRVDFSIMPGEAVGIIGPNGAGKSTVLKILAGIMRPTSGVARVRGRLAALIEVGAGFHGDLTGRENIHLNGAIMGMNRCEIAQKLDSIAAFAGLERFLDTPVKRYSSGMYARLGFSIAAHVEPDVLLVDEVLSVGDAAFRLRCLERMRELVAGGTTLVLVTHDLEQMQAICRQAIVFEGGRIAFIGEPGEAVGQYLRAMSRSSLSHGVDVAEKADAADSLVEVTDFRILDEAGGEIAVVRSRSDATVEFLIEAATDVPNSVLEANLRRATGELVLSINSGRSGVSLALSTGLNVVRLRLGHLPLSGGQYFWNVRLWDADAGTCLLDTPFSHAMVVNDAGRATGLMCIDHEWTVRTAGKPRMNDSQRACRQSAEVWA